MADKERDDSSVFVGRRPTMNYVMASMMVLNNKKDCTVKARGRAISHAVDVVEILRNRFMKDVKIKSINIDTEKLESNDGRTSNVSSIEIVLEPPK
ncbi:MAG: DNA-binding protein Alba [Promethearchaeota archaeon]